MNSLVTRGRRDIASLLALALLCTGLPGVGIMFAAGLPEGVVQLGTLEAPSLRESSGVIPHSKDSAVLWTHGDGRRPLLYAVSRTGKTIGTVGISGVTLSDWEDIASDRRGKLYIADTGNNDALRTEVWVHEVNEPDPAALPRQITPVRSWKLGFPKKPFDAEGLFVWDSHGYLVSKVSKNAKAGLYRFPLTHRADAVVLQRIGKLQVDSPITGADISPDGKWIGLVSKEGAAVIGVASGLSLESLEAARPKWIRHRHEHIEGCAFVPEGLLVTAESREIYLFQLP